MVNRVRGEVGFKAGGKVYPLSLSLGALAAIEAAFQAESYEDVFTDVLQTEKVSATKLLLMLTAVAEANGHDIGDELKAMPIAEMGNAALDLLTAAFPEPSEKKAKPARP